MRYNTLILVKEGRIATSDWGFSSPGKYDWTVLPSVTTQMANWSTPGEYDWTCAHWRHMVNTTEHVLPWAHPNPNDKSISSATSVQLTAESPYTLQWASLSPKIAPSHGGSGPTYNVWFLGSAQAHNPNGISIGSAIFVQMTAKYPYTL